MEGSMKAALQRAVAHFEQGFFVALGAALGWAAGGYLVGLL